ncbi:MAG: [FeFe] hydrogenase H-cluster maturation GTPase HydF [Firmicutes bacterium]|nr:[FeFe] hydrogenase H-cluster maturation GTPase HydF [Bacillota bacterium]
MSMNERPAAERVHIGFFGMRNAGKSSVVNAVTGQSLSLVSEVKGTTTDPVKKVMELLPLGPIVIIDTPGIDDEGQLGHMRVERAKETLRYIDIAVLVVDGTVGLRAADSELIEVFEEKRIPYLLACNKQDLIDTRHSLEAKLERQVIHVSAHTGEGIQQLKERIGSIVRDSEKGRQEKRLVADLLEPGDMIVLVVPIDKAAPKGRLILPQQQTIRDILEAGAMAIVTRDTELSETLDKLKEPPKLVITDSQVFEKVSKVVPENVLLTSFSILFARYKGDLEGLVTGAVQLERLEDGDRVLISEGCTHHRQCGDIGTEKLPAWVRQYTGKELEFSFTSGMEFPEDLSPYSLVIHCGGCMLNEKEMEYRVRYGKEKGVPMTNYGIAIAQIHGILKRSLKPFPWIETENVQR